LFTSGKIQGVYLLGVLQPEGVATVGVKRVSGLKEINGGWENETLVFFFRPPCGKHLENRRVLYESS